MAIRSHESDHSVSVLCNIEHTESAGAIVAEQAPGTNRDWNSRFTRFLSSLPVAERLYLSKRPHESN
jgi:hypothetical protein